MTHDEPSCIDQNGTPLGAASDVLGGPLVTQEQGGLELAVAEGFPEPPVGTLQVREVDFRKDSRWLEFLSGHPDALIYHHPAWLSALEKEYGRKCVALACEDGEGRLQGILPLLPTQGLPLSLSRHQIGRRLSSLPRTPLAGPLAKSREAAAALVQAALDRVRREPGMQLELKSTIPDLDMLVEGLQCVRWRDTYVRGLPENENPEAEFIQLAFREPRQCTSCDTCRRFRFGNSRDNHQVKWAVNKAIKSGLSLRVADSEEELRAWYRKYLHVMRRNVVPPRPFRFFQQLWKEMYPQGHMILVLVEQRESGSSSRHSAADSESQNRAASSQPESLVSGSILLQFGRTVFWAFTGTEQESFGLHVNDLTVWNCMHDSCREGYCWFDLGEVAEDHPELSQFKSKWGTIRRPMYRYYYPAFARSKHGEASTAKGRVTQIAHSVWRRLPLSAIALLGDWIFRYL